MIEKIKTLFWFILRPSHWRYMLELIIRKFRPDHDSPECRANATNWARECAVSVVDALEIVGLGSEIFQVDKALLLEAEERAKKSAVEMGGSADLNLLFSVVKNAKPKRIIETGVAYGWSSLIILEGLKGLDDCKLISVDMPYPKANNEDFVGIAVPERLRQNWEIVRKPDRNGLKQAIARHGGEVDLFHYDSDKSWWGRKFAFPLMWKHLRKGGVFISDDIQDNMFFAQFVSENTLKYAVTEFADKYVGIIVK